MELSDVFEALAEPFPADVVGWKPQTISGNRALAVAYIDARDVMDRLDRVVGPACWQDDYECLPDGSVLCRLNVRLGEQWVTKSDVGGESDQPDKGDKRKAAVSDALKRAAVKFGIGRYLYSLPQQWVDYDPQKKRLVNTPVLPTHALPRPGGIGAMSAMQRDLLVFLLRQAEADLAKFCSAYGIKDATLLPASKWQDACALLLKKAMAAAKARADQAEAGVRVVKEAT